MKRSLDRLHCSYLTLIFPFLSSYERQRVLHYEAKAELLHIGAKRQCFIWQGCYEARLTAYEARLTPHEAALRAMKRSLDRLH